jgi:hypothetical protein
MADAVCLLPITLPTPIRFDLEFTIGDRNTKVVGECGGQCPYQLSTTDAGTSSISALIRSQSTSQVPWQFFYGTLNANFTLVVEGNFDPANTTCRGVSDGFATDPLIKQTASNLTITSAARDTGEGAVACYSLVSHAAGVPGCNISRLQNGCLCSY